MGPAMGQKLLTKNINKWRQLKQTIGGQQNKIVKVVLSISTCSLTIYYKWYRDVIIYLSECWESFKSFLFLLAPWLLWMKR